nr:MAG TPA: PVL ORF-50-like family [Caudoviricetes sp.]
MMKQAEYDYYVTPEEYEIAAALGISKDLVNKRIRLYTWPKQMAISTRPNETSRYDKSVKVKLKKNGINESTFYKRIAYGWSIERASTEPIKLRKDIINKMADMRRRSING